MAKKTFTYRLSMPLSGATTASIDINTMDGNLKIDTPDEPELASGDLQYLENQEPPSILVPMNGSHADFTLKSGNKGQAWIRLP